MVPPWTPCSMTRRPETANSTPTRAGLSMNVRCSHPSPRDPARPMQPLEPGIHATWNQKTKTVTGTRTRPLLGGRVGGQEGPEGRDLGQRPCHPFPGASALPASSPAPRPGKEGRAEAAGPPFRGSLWEPLLPPRAPIWDPRPLPRPGVLCTEASSRP